MSNYSTDGNTKKTIDRLQVNFIHHSLTASDCSNFKVEFQCCGSRNYSDWYYVEWYDSNFIKKT